MIIECDSELVVFAMQGKQSYLVEVMHIIEECMDKLKHREDVVLCHVKKQANKAAHVLAKIPCLLGCYNYFMSLPNVLLEMVPSEFSS